MARTIAKDYDAKRVRILKVAAHVFAREGVARASMNQLATECGISKANIYHYYDGKDALLFGILETYLSALRNRLYALPLADTPASERLQLIVLETLLAYQGMDDEHKIQSEGIPLLPRDQQEILRNYQRDMVSLMSDVLVDIAPNVFAGHKAKLRATTMSVFGMLNWFYMWNSDAGSEARESYAALVAKLTLDGVKGL